MTATMTAPVAARPLQTLGSTVLNAAHFTDGQEKSETCKHVAKVWTDQCMTFAEGKEKLALDQSKIRDIRGPLSDWTTGINGEDKLVLVYKPTGEEFSPTAKAVKDIAVIGQTSEWFLSDLMADKVKENAKGDEKVVFKRDRRDAELLAQTVKVALFSPDRVDQKKPRLFRVWRDGSNSLRALLSEQYAIVNNLWYLDTLEKLIPGGLLSHWRGDADTIFGNVLIPDSIRVESDSHYGGMLSIGNSEIGLRRIMSLPSVFRAICMNGCIWEQEKGKAVSQVHRGEIDNDSLAKQIAKNLQAQIPLLSGGIDALLGTRSLSMGGVSTVQVVAQFFNDFKLPKSQAAKFFGHFNTEVEILGSEARTAFGLQAALTRLGQQCDNDTWVKFDQMAGAVVAMKRDKWDRLIENARTLDAKEVEATLGDVSHLI